MELAVVIIVLIFATAIYLVSQDFSLFDDNENRSFSRNESIRKKMQEKAHEFAVKQQKDINEMNELLVERAEKREKIWNNKNANDYTMYIEFEENIQEGTDQFIPHRVIAKRSGESKDPVRLMMLEMFPNAHLEVPDYDLVYQRKHNNLPYQIHEFWINRKKQKKEETINLN